jgi:hypothetical protein
MKGWEMVRDVYNLNSGNGAQNLAFNGTGEVVFVADVGSKGQYSHQ